MNDTNIVGKSLKRVREENNMTVDELVKLIKADLDLSADDILSIEAEQHLVYDYELQYWAKLFNVMIDEFFN